MEKVINKRKKKVAILTRLMPNIDEPSSLKTLLLNYAVENKLLKYARR